MAKVNTTGMVVAGAMGIASLAYMALSRPRRSKNAIPKKMKQLFLVKSNRDLNKVQFDLREVDTPLPKFGQVLVKICAAPVNPSDYRTWFSAQGELPMGLEGVGVVVATGGGLIANGLMGKTVGVSGMNVGTYKEYACMNATRVFPISACAPHDAASFFVNPMTTLAILETAREHGGKAFIHTAAASQLGQMMVKLSPSNVVNVVRRQEQVDLLKRLRAKYIVCTADNDWQEQLSSLIQELDIKVAFDAIAGEMSGTLVSLLPYGGTCYVYGGLSKQPVSGVSSIDLIYEKKQLRGFFLMWWIEKGGSWQTYKRLQRANKMVNEGLKPGGWAESTFIDCRLENMQEKFLELWNKGFTGEKLRIRMD